MKQLILSFAAMLLSLGALAQKEIKVIPQYHVNDTAIYRSSGVSTMSVMGSEIIINTTIDMRFVVKEKTADGYVVELYTSNVNAETGQGGLMAEMLSMSMKMIEGCNMKLALDREGKLIRILNFEEVKQQQLKVMEQAIDKLYQDHPQVESALPRQTIISQLEAQATEDAQLKSLLSTANIFAYNGLTLAQGAKSEYVNPVGVNMLREVTMLDTNKRYVETKAISKVTKEQMKQIIIDKVKENMQETPPNIESQIESMIDSGMMSLHFNEDANVTFYPNLYVKSIDINNSSDIMMQKTTVKTTVTCLHNNFK